MMLKNLKPNKIKWNKSQLIESDNYIRVFIKSLSPHFGPSERQKIYFISKLFVDGTVEVGQNRFELADHFFNRGEFFLNKMEDGSIMKMMLINIYDRSKSLYFYKLGEHEKAIGLINNALQINGKLEAQGFSFMAFDRFSQYHNLSKIYFSKNEPEKGIAVLSDVISFLMTAKPNSHVDSIPNFLETLDADGVSMRSSLLCMLLFETIGKFQLEKDGAIFMERSDPFFSKILDSSINFLLLSKTDHYIKQWVMLMEHFYRKDFKRFKIESLTYLKTEQTFYGNTPSILLRQYLDYVDAF